MKNNLFTLFIVISSFMGCAGRTPPFETALQAYYPNVDAKRLSDNIGFPAKMAFLAYGASNSTAPMSNHDFLGELSDQAEQDGDFERIGIGNIVARGELQDIFVERKCTIRTSIPDETRNQLITMALGGVVGQSGFEAEHVQDAIRLIQTGQFYRDINSSVIAVSSVLPKFASGLVQSQPSDLYESIKSDFRDNSPPLECLQTLRLGKNCDQPKVLRNTLGKLYQNPTLGVTRETMSELLSKESIRLAIIVYARSNGVDIDDEHLENARMILSDEDPDLYKFSRLGADRLIEKYGVTDAKHRLDKMSKNQNCDGG